MTAGITRAAMRKSPGIKPKGRRRRPVRTHAGTSSANHPLAMRTHLRTQCERIADAMLTSHQSPVILQIHHRHAQIPEPQPRSEEHTSELQSLMRISYAVFCLKKKKINSNMQNTQPHTKS